MKTILLMEDDPQQARLMQRLLEYAGHKVLHAPDGESGLRTALMSKPDLILLDLGLPDLDGQTVAGLIKGSTELFKVPLVAVTAWPRDTALQMARAYGCDGCIPKPIRAREFAHEVESYFAAEADQSDDV
ncbi:MAG: response regulator [Anaerolineae bacterium]|nr:response regulator [Anaerolineae bacterium]